MSLVSIIMPTFNAERWVSDTIDNLAQQTYPQMELIVVDDASSDGTVPLVRQKLEKDFKHDWRIIEFDQNQGPSAARNAGLRVAKGSWVQFLDSDDFLAPSKFELQMAQAAAAAPEVAFIYAAWCFCHAEGGDIVQAGDVFNPDMTGKAPIMCLVGDRPLQGAGLARRSALEAVGGFDESLRFWECEELTLRLASAGRLERTPSSEPLYLWRLHPGQYYIGRDNARYKLMDVTASWMTLMLNEARGRTLSELGLSDAEVVEIRRNSTQWARLLYAQSPAAFREYTARARQLDPDAAPAYPKPISVLSRYIGYEGAEAVAKLARYPRTWARDLMQKLSPRPQASVFDWR